VHLRAFSDHVSVWQDSDIRAGEDWRKALNGAISTADAAIILVSANYLSSKFVAEKELPPLLQSARAGKTVIIPVMVSAAYIPRHHPLWEYQFANDPTQPLDTLTGQDLDKIFVKIAEVIASEARRRVNPVRSAEPPPQPVVSDETPHAVSASLAAEIAAKVAELIGSSSKGAERGSDRTGSPRQPIPSDLVFVIMSYTEDMEPVFEGIAAAAASVGLRAERVKDVKGDYRITDKIMEMILSSRLVVADLTNERPNVYFELGYARGIGKSVITIARRDAIIHFDVKDWTYIPYIDSRLLERDLKQRFEYEIEREK